MKRTTITITDEVALALEREMARKGTSASAVIRTALTAYLGLNNETPRLLPFAKLGDSGHKHTARDAEEILSHEWTHAIDR